MLALIAALFLGSPIVAQAPPACDENGYPVQSEVECRAACRWWSRGQARCRDVDVEYLGPWDPRPAPADWPAGYSTRLPEPWPSYATEKRSTEER